MAKSFGIVHLLLSTLLFWAAPASAQISPSALILHVDGVIGPASADYVAQGIAKAAEDRSPVIIIQIDTPGGLESSMREIIKEILGAPAPVITYVSPSGARAASAGTFIVYASHVAAMAPGTNLGAATPVQIGAPGPLSPPSKPEGADDETEPTPQDASAAKAVNDSVAYIRSLAELRGRNADWAESAVRTSASLSANVALDENVIDLTARDMNELMTKLHGRKLTVNGSDVTLDTRNLSRIDFLPNWRTKMLGAITNPNIALIFLLIGVYGLLFEFMNPGALYPGTIGAVCLLVGLYALAALPVNYAGMALIMLGIALMIGEAFSPSFGILGIGGAIAFIFGATILIDTDIPQFQISWPLLASLAVISLIFVVFVARLALTSHRRAVVSGKEEMIGKTGIVDDWTGNRGHIIIHSERWRAASTTALQKGQQIRVTGLQGLTLAVQPEHAAKPTYNSPLTMETKNGNLD